MKLKKLNARGFSHHFAMVLVVLICAIGGTYYLVASHADDVSTQLYLSPTSAPETVGNDFTVAIDLNANGNSINFTHAAIEYPSNLLACVSANSEPGPFPVGDSATCGNGIVTINQNLQNQNLGGTTASNVPVATITFRALATGTASVDFLQGQTTVNIHQESTSPGTTPSTGSSTGSGAAPIVAVPETSNAQYTISTTTTQPSTPAAPTNLTATAVSSSQINLSWAPSAGATSYIIYRSGGGNAVIFSTASTSYVNTDLSPGTSYKYYVIATNSVGTQGEESPASNTVSATTTPTTAPAAPTNLTATAVSSSQINLSWAPSAGAVAGYNVYRNGTEVAEIGTGSTLYESTGLSPSTRYSYYVAAYNSNGQLSSPTTTLSVVTQSASTSTSAEQLSVPPQRRPSQYLSLCEVGKTAYVSDGTSNCWVDSSSLIGNYSPNVPGTYYNVPCVSVSTYSASDRFVYIAPGETCPEQTTAVPLQLLAGEQLSSPPARRPASYLTQCNAGNITYVSLNSCVYRLANTAYQFTYTPPVAGTYYSDPCATVTQEGQTLRYLYVSAAESCPADTFGTLSLPNGEIAKPM